VKRVDVPSGSPTPVSFFVFHLPVYPFANPKPQPTPLEIRGHQHWWPTSLIGGERPGGSEFGGGGT
jgi:hypothetical protein